MFRWLFVVSLVIAWGCHSQRVGFDAGAEDSGVDGDACAACGISAEDCLECGLDNGYCPYPSICPEGSEPSCPTPPEWIDPCTYTRCFRCEDGSWAEYAVDCFCLEPDAGVPDAMP